MARIDLKAGRQPGVLRALRVTLEPGARVEAVERLRAELDRMAVWLGLGDV